VANPILAFTSKYKAAVFEKNVEEFVALYGEKVRVFDAWGVWSIDGIGAWRKMATEWLGSLGDESVVVDFDDILSTVNEGVAFGSAYVTYTALDRDGKKLRSLQNRHTWGLERNDGVWKTVHEHSSAPADFETLKISLQRKP
jgi:ketosteroid isomerase-like protein